MAAPKPKAITEEVMLYLAAKFPDADITLFVFTKGTDGDEDLYDCESATNFCCRNHMALEISGYLNDMLTGQTEQRADFDPKGKMH
jgi:hypothetical protein